MSDTNFRNIFMIQIMASFSWMLTIGSAIIITIGSLAADWSWSYLWISGGLFLLTMVLSMFAGSRIFKEMDSF